MGRRVGKPRWLRILLITAGSSHESGESLNHLLEKVMLATDVASLRGRKSSSERVLRGDFFDHELLQVPMPSCLVSDPRESVPAKGLPPPPMTL